MCGDKMQKRVLLLHYWKKGVNAIEAVRQINDIEGDDTVNIRQVHRLFKRFKEGDTSLERIEGYGQMSSFDSQKLCESIEKNPTSTRILSREMGHSNSTIHSHLKRLGKSFVAPKEVPHDLSESQIKQRLHICVKLFKNPNDERFFKRIVTRDERWIFLNNYNHEKQWLDKGDRGIQIPKDKKLGKKVMLYVWWNYEGMVYFDLLEYGRTVNSELYKNQLTKIHEKLQSCYPSLANRKRVILQHDNARPHVSKTITQKFNEWEWELLPHSSYSPDIAQSDYHLFRSMEYFFHDKKFNNVEDVKNACTEFFASKSKD